MNEIELKKYRYLIDKSLKNYLKKVIGSLPAFNNSFIKRQYDLIQDYCMKSGKRLRPILSIAAFYSVGGKNVKKYMNEILALEIYHNYTLIHDDVYDEDDQRRGKRSMHVLFESWLKNNYKIQKENTKLYKNNYKRFGAISAIIAGKYLQTISYFPILDSKHLSDEQKNGLIRLFQKISIYDNTGQAMDLMFEKENVVDESDYFNMVECKTGMLFRVSVLCGAIIGNAQKSQLKALEKYIDNIATAFQIKDDLIDIGEGTKGRGLGSDIRQGKKTLLAIHLLNNASQKDKKYFINLLGNKNISEVKIKKAIGMMKKYGSVAYCEKEAEKRIIMAVTALNLAKPALIEKSKVFLAQLGQYMLSRKK